MKTILWRAGAAVASSRFSALSSHLGSDPRRGGLHEHQQEAACCLLGSARCDYGGLCIVSGWPHAHNSRIRLIWTQVLHWAAFLATMNLLLYTDVAQMLSAEFDRTRDPSDSCAWNLRCWRSYVVLANWRARRGGSACGPRHRLDRGIRAAPCSRRVRFHCACRHFLVVRAASWFGRGSGLKGAKGSRKRSLLLLPQVLEQRLLPPIALCFLQDRAVQLV